MATSRQGLAIEQCTVFVEAHTAFGEPAHCQRVDLVFLGMHPVRQGLWRVGRLYRNHCLYDQWSAIEFLGDEVHGAAVLCVAGFQRALMSV